MSATKDRYHTMATGVASSSPSRRPFRVHGLLAAGLIIAGVALGPVLASAQPVAAADDGQAQARATLMRMAGLLGGAQAFSVTMDTSYDAVQEDGQKIEFG